MSKWNNLPFVSHQQRRRNTYFSLLPQFPGLVCEITPSVLAFRCAFNLIFRVNVAPQHENSVRHVCVCVRVRGFVCQGVPKNVFSMPWMDPKGRINFKRSIYTLILVYLEFKWLRCSFIWGMNMWICNLRVYFGAPFRLLCRFVSRPAFRFALHPRPTLFVSPTRDAATPKLKQSIQCLFINCLINVVQEKYTLISGWWFLSFAFWTLGLIV